MSNEQLRESICRALTDYELAVEGVIATQSGDDPHAATLAVQAADRAREVLATWTQPEYIRALLNLAIHPSPEIGWELLGYIPTDAIEQIKAAHRLITTNVPVLSYLAEGHTAIYTAQPPAQGVPDAWSDGVQAAADLLKRMASELATERGETDPDTGAVQFKSATTREWHASLCELAEEIERLKPAPQDIAAEQKGGAA